MANPDKDGFTLVKGGRQSKKRKDGSPLLHSPPGASSASPINTPARPRPSTYRNSVPIILSDVDPKFNSVVKLMSELRQFHPCLRVSKVQELKNNRFLVIGDTPRDVAILQSDNKMKACLGQNVSASLPKAYQTATTASKTLVVKGVPTEVSEKDFKEFLDLNKIIYAKAERLTSKKDGRVLQMFKLEIKDEAEAEALISQNLTCHTTSIIYKVEEFRFPVSVQQCWNCQSFCHSAKTCRSKTKCVVCGESHHHKGCPNREKKQPKCATVKGHMLLLTKGVQRTKNKHLDNVVDNQKSYAAILRQNTAPPQPQDKTFTFSAEQLVKFVAIQIAQPQVCYINSPQDAIDKKSSMCRRVSEAAKTHLGVDIAGSNLFDAIGHLRPPAPSAPNQKPFLPKVKPPSNSAHPPKSPINHLPSLRHSTPLTNLARLSPNSLKLHSRSIILGHLS